MEWGGGCGSDLPRDSRCVGGRSLFMDLRPSGLCQEGCGMSGLGFFL